MKRVDNEAAYAFLKTIGVSPPLFQSIPEREDCVTNPRVLMGWNRLGWAMRQNWLGANVGVVVNDHDGSGKRRIENMTYPRWLVMDLDGAPIDPVMCWDAMQPHLVVETSPGRFHCYYELSRSQFIGLRKPWQYAGVCRQLAQRFGGDPQFGKLNQAMRIPGFWHQKREPFQVRIWHESGHEPYSSQHVFKYLDRPQQPAPIPQSFPSSNPSSSGKSFKWKGALNGSRNEYLTRACWVLRNQGLSMEEARSELMRADDANSPPIKTEPGGVRTINDMIRRAYSR